MLRMNTRVIKSCKKENICGNIVAMSRERNKDVVKSGTFIVMSESQVHWGIQHGKCDHVLQSETFVQCRAHYRGCEGSQRVTKDGKHAKQFSCGAGCQQHDDD